MRLAILAHVDAEQRVLVVEQEAGERLGELGLPDAGRAKEQERADWAARIAEARARAADRIRHRHDRLILVHHPRVQRLLQVEQLVRLLGEDAATGMPVHCATTSATCSAVTTRLGSSAAAASGCSVSRVSRSWRSSRRLLVVAALPGLVLARLQLRDLGGRGVLGLARRAQPQLGGRLVHQVDRLVRQRAVLDVPVGQRDGSRQRRVLDLEAVVLLVPLAQAEQDLDRLLDGRLVHEDRRETPLQGRVALDPLAVVVQGRRADQRIWPRARAGLSRLAASIAPSAPPAPTSVWISSMNRITAPSSRDDLVDDRLQPLLELAPELRAGQHRRQVERDQALALQRLGHALLDHHAGPAPRRRPSCRRPARRSGPDCSWCGGSAPPSGAVISCSRPMTGSSLPCRASSVRSTPYFSSAWNRVSALGSSTVRPPRTASNAASSRSRSRSSDPNIRLAGSVGSARVARSRCSVPTILVATTVRVLLGTLERRADAVGDIQGATVEGGRDGRRDRAGGGPGPAPGRRQDA